MVQLEQKQQTDACALICEEAGEVRRMRSPLAFYLFFLLNPSFTHGHLLGPASPTPPRIVLSPKNSPIRSASTALWPQVREWSEIRRHHFFFSPFPTVRDVVRTIIFFISYFNILLIRNQARVLHQHTSCQCLWRIWTRPSTELGKRSILFRMLPCTMCTFFMAWHLYIIETHCETIGWFS